MKFEKGNKAAKGGKRNPPGGPDARKATVPDAKHTIAIEGEGLLEQAVRRVRERKNGGKHRIE